MKQTFLSLLTIALLLLTSMGQSAYGQGGTTDAQGRKQGYWKKTDAEGKLIYEGSFKDDKPQGKFKYYYPNDTLKALIQFRDNGKASYARLFHPTGKRMAEGKYIGEIKDSTWVYYDEAGVKISTETYALGKKNGKSLVYLPNGDVAEERKYKMDVQDGPFKLYFDKTHVKGEGVYVDGQLEGKVSYYYPNGNTAAMGFYKNGLRHGPWIYKEQDGKIKEKEYWQYGKQASEKETEEFFNKNKTIGNEPEKKTTPDASSKKTNTTHQKTGAAKTGAN